MDLKNLRIAVDGIKKLNIPEEKFDMYGFGGISHRSREDVEAMLMNPVCGTPACFLGYFPFLEELRPVNEDYFSQRFNYHRYSFRILGDIGEYVWGFLFGSGWYDLDNTLAGALARAEYILAGNDVPKVDKWHTDFSEGWHIGTPYEQKTPKNQ